MCVSPLMGNDSQWIGADNFPVVALAQLLALRIGHRGGTMQHLLDEAARTGRRVEEHHAAGVAAAVLPRMRDVAREERARARPAHADLLADDERALSREHPGHLVAVSVQVDATLSA